MLLPTTGCLVANPAWLGDDGADETGTTGVDSTTSLDDDDDDDDAMGTVGPPPTGGGTETGAPSEADDTNAMPEPPPTDWWDTAWQFRRPLQVSLDAIVQPTAIPIRIDGSDDPRRFAEGGRDVRFVTSAGEHRPHEIDTWQPLDGSGAVVWVRIAPGGDQEPLYMYYGNPSAAANDKTSGVWSPELSAVWHLGSDVDSTMQVDQLEPAVEVGPGVVGDAAVFGPGSEIAFTTFDAIPTSATITAWILPVDSGEQEEGRIVDLVIPEMELGFALHITSFSGQPELAVTATSAGQRELSALVGVPLELGAWHFVVLTISDEKTMELFVDGEGGAPEPLTVEADMPPAIMDPTLAIGGPVNGLPQRFEGTIDEVRLRSGSLGAEQIQDEYQTQQILSGALGPEESL